MDAYGSLRKTKPSDNSDVIQLIENGQTRPHLQRRPSTVYSELVLTEIKYIQDLSYIVKEYIPKVLNSEIPKPDDLRGKAAYLVFGNIQTIYDWHSSEFLTAIRRCIDDPSNFGTAIEKIEKTMLALYFKYFRNKPVSAFILQKHKRYFENIDLDKSENLSEIRTYLQYPVDRIFKYKLLFSLILKQAEKGHEEGINKAINVMERIMSALNNLMALWRLENFPENIDDQGNLICHESLYCSEEISGHKWLSQLNGVSKPKRFHVFLLQGSIIFANIKGGGNSSSEEKYEYCFHIKVNQVKLGKRLTEGIRLNLRIPNKKGSTCFIIRLHDEKTSKKWMNAIEEAISYQETFKNSILEPVS